MKQFISGLWFYFFKNKKVEIIAKKRKVICDLCLSNSTVMKKLDDTFKPIRVDEYCLECKCNLKLKQRSLKSKCPNNLW